MNSLFIAVPSLVELGSYASGFVLPVKGPYKLVVMCGEWYTEFELLRPTFPFYRCIYETVWTIDGILLSSHACMTDQS